MPSKTSIQQVSRSNLDVIPFSDLGYQWDQIKDKALPDIHRLFESGAFSLGAYVERFEQSVADYIGAPHAIGVNSGTSALHLALIAAGIGPGDKVLIPTHTFIATAWAVLYVGAKPVLCDVDATTATIDLADAERRMDPTVKAIIPVHLYGQPADMDAVLGFANRHGLTVIEDAAQAFGARFKGKCVGTMGLCGCFSFYPAKNLGAAGEAGLIVTSDEAIGRRLRALRHHSQVERYVHDELGFNYRMDGLQGLVLSHKLPLVDSWTQRRRELAGAYQEHLSALPVTLPQVLNHDHVFHLYVVLTDRRDDLRAYLQNLRIETGLHYPLPLHAQPALSHLISGSPNFPVAERYARECLSLPLFPSMTEAQIDRVCAAIKRFFS